ncbi:Elastin microfibril interfacer 2 [Mactra antiquata]
MDKYLNVLLVIMLGAQTHLVASEPVCSKFAYEEQLLEKMVRWEWKMERMVDDIDNFKSEWKNMNKDIETKIESISTMLNDVNERVASIAKDQEKTMVELNAEELTTMAPTVDSSRSVVAFSASSNTSDYFLDGDPILFPDIVYNEGGGFDVDTGIFTAPETGWYLFLAHMCIQSNVIYKSGYSIVNDGNKIFETEYSILFNRYRNTFSVCLPGSVITHMRSGGEVIVQCSGGCQNNLKKMFSGVLLSRV